MELKAKHLFDFVAYFIIVVNFLPIVINNIPEPFSSYYFWVLLWFFLTIFFNNKMILNKSFLRVLIYCFFAVILTQTVWSNVSYYYLNNYIIVEIISIYISVAILHYYFSRRDYYTLSKLSRFSIFCIVITSITTIIGTLFYPNASRDLAGVLARDEKFYLIEYYQSLGIGNYSFVASLVPFSSVVLYHFRKDEKIYYFVFLIIFIALLQAKYFANIIIVILLVLFYYFDKINFSFSLKYLILFLSVIIFLILPISFYVEFSLFLADLFSPNSVLYSKFYDLSNFIKYGFSFETGVALRASRFPLLTTQFLKKPIIGFGYGNIHLHWLSKLSVFGIVGSIPLFIILYKEVHNNKKLFKQNYNKYYMLAIFSYLLLGTIKSLLGKEIIVMVFLILPMHYYTNIKWSDTNNSQPISGCVKL